MPTFLHDAIEFHYCDQGSGRPVVFQHGLGGDVQQPLGLFAPPPGVRLLSMDARGHGQTRPVGPAQRFSFAAFADDMAAWLDHLDLPRAVIGGISMGAGVAVNFALRYPDRVRALVLSRPAWLDRPMPENVRVFDQIGSLIETHGACEGQQRFRQSATYQAILAASPDMAASLLGQFAHPRAEETVVKLRRMPADAPLCDLERLRQVAVPTLVLVNDQDPVHPRAFGEALASAIPGAIVRELTPKSVSVERHAADVQRWMEAFLAELRI